MAILDFIEYLVDLLFFLHKLGILFLNGCPIFLSLSLNSKIFLNLPCDNFWIKLLTTQH